MTDEAAREKAPMTFDEWFAFETRGIVHADRAFFNQSMRQHAKAAWDGSRRYAEAELSKLRERAERLEKALGDKTNALGHEIQDNADLRARLATAEAERDLSLAATRRLGEESVKLHAALSASKARAAELEGENGRLRALLVEWDKWALPRGEFADEEPMHADHCPALGAIPGVTACDCPGPATRAALTPRAPDPEAGARAERCPHNEPWGCQKCGAQINRGEFCTVATHSTPTTEQKP
ncbi:MAG: hypothetical protein ACYC6M_03020 [Terriglobales bacterium]